MNESPSNPSIALAIFAHPDDIEFTCAGTLALLRQNGYVTHYLNLANGCCGSMTEDRSATAKRRWRETQAAGKVLGATTHPPLFNDLEVFFNEESARKVAAIVRNIRPNIILTHATDDYMEDHMNTARLALHAAFTMGMPNYTTDPAVAPAGSRCALYHAMPHGLCRPSDGRRVYPELYVGIDAVLEKKREALACHESQKIWLDQTQGMNAYLDAMAGFARTLGEETDAFQFAEGFTRHFHMGLSDAEYQPLEEVLGDSISTNLNYPNSPALQPQSFSA